MTQCAKVIVGFIHGKCRQRFLSNVYKRFFIFRRFLRFLTFFILSERLSHLWAKSLNRLKTCFHFHVTLTTEAWKKLHGGGYGMNHTTLSSLLISLKLSQYFTLYVYMQLKSGRSRRLFGDIVMQLRRRQQRRQRLSHRQPPVYLMIMMILTPAQPAFMLSLIIIRSG